MATRTAGGRDFIVADDHPMVRQAVRMVLEIEYPGHGVAEAGTLDAVLEAVSLSPNAMVIIDLDMPGMNGAESLRALRQGFPDLLMAVLSGNGDRQVILEALAAGVNGYILKASPSDELLYAIATILTGRIYVTGTFVRSSAAASAAPAPARAPEPTVRAAPKDRLALTPREHEVLVCLMKGHSNKQIARQLGIGEGTVKVHLASIFRTLGAQNRTGAVLVAVEHGLSPGNA
jgi:DNA-binding NarL/FixJ family response regulator